MFGAPYRRDNNARFESQYHVHSTGYAGKEVYDGDKIFLPPSALDRLARMNVDYPMLFEIINNVTGRRTHCGVLEFSSEEGFCYMPYWMMENLALSEGQLLTVKNVSLPKATFVKFRAQSVDFIEVSNPRALLEVTLRMFTCLTVGDVVRIPHGGRQFYLEVREVQPNGAASIIETDCNVDFEEPLGYKESKYAEMERKHKENKAAEESKALADAAAARTLQKARIEEEEDSSASAKFKPFTGAPKRIDGKLPVSVQQAKMAYVPPAEEKGRDTVPSDSKTVSNGGGSSAISAPVYESRIGDKYSKKKSAVSAFMGPPRKLGS